MKCGRLTGQEVSDFSEILVTILKKNQNSVALVIAPYLISEKVAGYRGELRTDRLTTKFQEFQVFWLSKGFERPKNYPRQWYSVWLRCGAHSTSLYVWP